MVDGFLGGLSNFAGGVGDFFTGGGVYADPKNINQRYGVPEADVRQAGLGALGNVGALLLAAGQSPDRGQRAQFLGQLGGAVSGMNTDIYKSSQARLMNAQQQGAMRDLEENRALSAWAQNPENLKSVGLTPEQFRVVGTAGLKDIVKSRSSRDPVQAALAQESLAEKQRAAAQRQQAITAINSLDLTEQQRQIALSNPSEFLKSQTKPVGSFVEEARTIDGKTVVGQKDTRTGQWKPYSSGAGVNINMGDRALEQGIAKSLMEGADLASSAASAIQSIGTARELFGGGIISGITAPVEETIRKIGTALGFDDEQVSNTEAFRSALAPVVLATVRGLGAGVSISNADREYAEKFAGGNTKLDNASIEKILGIVEKYNRQKIESHNSKVKKYIEKAKDPSNAEFLLVDIPKVGKVNRDDKYLDVDAIVGIGAPR
jgi:hypothetical protein